MPALNRILVTLLALLLCASPAFSELSPAGTYTGSTTGGTLKRYKLAGSLRVTEPLPGTGVFVLRGTFAVSASGAKATKLTLKGDDIGGTSSGRITYLDDKGRKRTTSFKGSYNSGIDSYFISFDSSTFGDFEFILRRKIDLTGTWIAADGSVMTIRKGKNGFFGTYAGSAATGHGDLRATYDGPVDSKRVWSGEYHVTELSASGSGEFALKYINGSPEVLDGFVSSQTGAFPVRLTKQP